ncbi:hypothetical protein COB52_00580 [Candidatus Kaiserbacteria bacterium]|nr:MAG: hypothetical protein COB52_00580 [Candidatus Kaiserbacteria bacterium]
MISAGSSDRMVYVWDTDTGEMLHKLGGHEGSVNQTCFHPTQKDLIASGSSDKTVYLGYLKD